MRRMLDDKRRYPDLEHNGDRLNIVENEIEALFREWASRGH
jgi:hypothetical protein